VRDLSRADEVESSWRSVVFESVLSANPELKTTQGRVSCIIHKERYITKERTKDAHTNPKVGAFLGKKQFECENEARSAVRERKAKSEISVLDLIKVCERYFLIG